MPDALLAADATLRFRRTSATFGDGEEAPTRVHHRAIAPSRPRVVVADADPETAGWIARRLVGLADVVPVTSGAAVVELFRAQAFPVTIVGAHLDDLPAERLMTALAERRLTTVIAIAPASAAAPVGVFYQIDRTLARDAVRLVVERALDRSRPRDADELVEPLHLQRLAAASRRVAMQRSAGDVARAIAEIVPGLVDAERVRVLFFDGDSGALWAEPEAGEAALERPATGLLGFAARTARPVFVDRAGDDPRYRPAADEPALAADARLAAVPVVDPDGEVHAVIALARGARGAAFEPAERAMLTAFAARVAPVLDAFALEARAESLAPPRESDLFRPEAKAAYQVRHDEGRALQIAPRWTSATYWLVSAVVVAALVYLCLGRIDEHAAGPAVVIADDRRAVTVASRGTVDEVRARPGDRVAAGDELFRLRDDGELVDAEAIEREYEQRVVERLERPDDDATAANLSAVIARRQRAELALAVRVVRAPVAGVVADVRIRTGRVIEAGEEALTLVEGDGTAGASIVALLPAGEAPLIRPGTTARLQLDGHRGVFATVVIDAVSVDATGPATARQILGDSLADALPLRGPMVVVRAHLTSREFVADGRALAYRHGMTGQLAIRVRSQRLITALVPGLSEVLGDDD